MTLIIRRSSALLLMTDLYHPSTLSFTSLSWWLKGWLFTRWLKEDTKLQFITPLPVRPVYAHSPSTGLSTKACFVIGGIISSSLTLRCFFSWWSDSLKGGTHSFFSKSGVIILFCKSCKNFFNVRQRSWWYKFYCLTVVTEPTKGIMQNLSKHCNTILEFLWSTTKVVGIFRSELWPTTESSWLALEEAGQQMLQNKAGYHGWA